MLAGQLLAGCLAICVSATGFCSSRAQSVSADTTANPPAATIPPAAQASRDVEPPANKPLPDVATLMHRVEENQRRAEAIEKNYLYHSVLTEQELDGRGRVKKTTVTESDHFWLEGVPVRRVVKREGRDLSPNEIARENERLDKVAAKARERREKADAKGRQSDPNGNEEITVSRLLELGAFANPRRVEIKGRPTIAIDYTGDPRARTRNSAENLIRQLAGTVWIDERDCVLARVEGRFANAFKVGGGLLVDIKQGTSFRFEQTKINDEVWLPAQVDAEGSARVLLFVGFSGRIHAVESDYRKFRTKSTILPGVAEVPDATKTPEAVKP